MTDSKGQGENAPVRGKRRRAVTKIFCFQGWQAEWGGKYFTERGAWSLCQVHAHGRYQSKHQRHRM